MIGIYDDVYGKTFEVLTFDAVQGLFKPTKVEVIGQCDGCDGFDMVELKYPDGEKKDLSIVQLIQMVKAAVCLEEKVV